MRITLPGLLTAAMLLITSCGNREQIVIYTELGDIQVTLDLKNAPATSANFLRYADARLFDSTCFYRVVRPDNQPKDSVRIEVIQGGRYEEEETGGFPPIAHETTEQTGIRHLNGVISMARWTPGTATSEFFICVGDQPELDFEGKRNPDGQGFAAFGRVTRGMDVVRKIHSIEAPGQYLEKPVVIYSITRK
ncbi:MAG: peptidylprolyl isomerase [Bacteroidales bacterium]|jgi:peptidyl-prolyl cis-trans isomerase A (cyclophilin A)|nr:peptidylprolyl isomerase [Bacteroidales bacterium]